MIACCLMCHVSMKYLKTDQVLKQAFLQIMAVAEWNEVWHKSLPYIGLSWLTGETRRNVSFQWLTHPIHKMEHADDSSLVTFGHLWPVSCMPDSMQTSVWYQPGEIKHLAHFISCQHWKWMPGAKKGSAYCCFTKDRRTVQRNMDTEFGIFVVKKLCALLRLHSRI